MAPSSRITHRLLPLLLLVAGLAAANADVPFFCPSNMNFSHGSVFEDNFDAVLYSLPAAAATAAGFAKKSTSAAPDEAYGLAQGRPAFNVSACLTRLDGLAREMPSKCPSQKNYMFIHDKCRLQYSNASFFGTVDTESGFVVANQENVTQPEQFKPFLADLMMNLTGWAAYKSPRMFAGGIGTADFTPSMKIYGTTECTRDLDEANCEKCLSRTGTTAVLYLPTEKKGVKVVLPSCSVRFELYPFYNA